MWRIISDPHFGQLGLSFIGPAEPIHGVKAQNRFGMQRAQTRRDLVEQQLPNLSIRQSGEPLCQHGGNQQSTGEPLHGVFRVHELSLLFDQSPDVQFASHFQSTNRAAKSSG